MKKITYESAAAAGRAALRLACKAFWAAVGLNLLVVIAILSVKFLIGFTAFTVGLAKGLAVGLAAGVFK